MWTGFVNCFKLPELRHRILFTLALLFIVRLGTHLPLPGLDSKPLHDFYLEQAGSGKGSGLLSLYNLFTGGALLNGAICALGIMPYISASIIMQLLGAFLPLVARLQQEGESGRQKLSQYTRYLTILICLIQGFLLIRAFDVNPGMLLGGGFDPNLYGRIVIASPLLFKFTSTVFLTAGTLALMWLGDQISQKGIGNGISLVITVNVVSDLPKALYTAFQLLFAPVGVESRLDVPKCFLMLCVLALVTAAIIAVTQAVRKIPVHYAKRMVGRNAYAAQNSFLPFKINYSGVMPVIFGSAILMFPMQIFSQLGAATGLRFFIDAARILERGTWLYYSAFSLLILLFSYFWVSVMFRPTQVADELKKNGGYVPGVKPGIYTAQFLDFVMTRLTLAGALFLTFIAVFPDLLFFTYNIPYQIAMFFGGTGMLITVGVILDTMKQVETILIERNYQGFIKRGALTSRFERLASAGSLASSTSVELKQFYWAVSSCLIVGLLVGVYSTFN